MKDADIEFLKKKRKLYIPPEIGEIEDEYLQAFIGRCLSVDLKERPLASVAIEFLKDCISRANKDPSLC